MVVVTGDLGLLLTECAGQERSALYCDRVHQVAVVYGRDARTLAERAAEDRVDHLQAPADREERQASRDL